MTEAHLKKRIAHFAARMAATRDHRTTPQGKRAYTIARNKWRASRRQLIRLQTTGFVIGWNEVQLED